MKFMILVKSNPDLEARLAAMSDSQMKGQMAAMGVFNEELKKAAVMKDCDGRRDAMSGARGCPLDGGLGACFSKRGGEQNPAVFGGLEAKLRVKSERRRIRVPDFYLDRLAGT